MLRRDLTHLLAIVDELRSRGVGVRVLAGAEIDTSTPNGRLAFGIFASLAEFGREVIAERTRATRASTGRRSGSNSRLPKAGIATAPHGERISPSTNAQ